MKLFFTLLLSFVIGTAWGQQGPVCAIPFSIEDNAIYIYCKVNENDSVKFLFDTGANGSVINSRSVKKLGLKLDGRSTNQGSNGSNEVALSTGNEIGIGPITRKGIALTIIPYATDAFDGVFGTDLMQGNIIAINYDKKEIQFHEQDNRHVDFSGYEKNKLYLVDGYPAVKSRLLIKGRTYSGLFGLDTGADDVLTLASPFVRKNGLEGKMQSKGALSFQGSDGSVYEMPTVICPSIELAGKFLYDMPISLSRSVNGIDATDKMLGFFGNNLLKRFDTIIDFKNQSIYFRLNKNLYSPIE